MATARKAVDILDLAKQFKSHEEDFVLHTNWRKIRSIPKLSWQSVRFESASAAAIPAKPGIYAFIVSFEHASFPAHGYVMYVGIAGEKGTNRTLKVRFGDYLQEKKSGKRPRVYFMLNVYEQDLFFHYAAVDGRVNLERLEQKINDAFIPPISKRDFSAEMRKAIGAFR